MEPFTLMDYAVFVIIIIGLYIICYSIKYLFLFACVIVRAIIFGLIAIKQWLIG